MTTKSQNRKKKKPAAKKKTETKALAIIKPEYSTLPEMVDGDYKPGQLIMAAIQGKAGIDTIERLVALAEKMKAIQAKDAYNSDLSLFQKKCPSIKKTKPVYDKETDGKGNKKIRYTYAPLESIIEQTKEILEECGFSFHIETKQSKESVTAICLTHHRAGHSESTQVEIPIDEKAYMNIQQKVASALTFAKRYAFCNAFGIMTADEDDDANSAGKPGLKKQPEPKQPIKNELIEKAKILLDNPLLRDFDSTKKAMQNIADFENILNSGKSLSPKRIEWLKLTLEQAEAKRIELLKSESDLDKDADAGWDDANIKNVTPPKDKKSATDLFPGAKRV